MDAIDLHVHSTFSDGTLTPSELISRAKAVSPCRHGADRPRYH